MKKSEAIALRSLQFDEIRTFFVEIIVDHLAHSCIINKIKIK